MREKLASLVISSLLLCGPVLAQGTEAMCGVPDMDPETARWIHRLAEGYERKADVRPVRIPVAFHVITAGPQGRVTMQQIRKLMSRLNWGFRGTPYSFYLQRVDRLNNPAWFNDCGPDTANEAAMKRRLARDPKRVLNIYSCKPYIHGLDRYVNGISSYPSDWDEGSFLHGIQLNPASLPGSTDPRFRNHGIAAHEVGHYLGLFHTFQGGCGATGDYVADTPSQAEPHNACPESIDTCPDAQGPDDVRNFMNYSDDRCMEHFTPGQIERMIEMTGMFRPTLVPW